MGNEGRGPRSWPTKAQLRIIGIFNSHDVAQVCQNKLYIAYAPGGGSFLTPRGWYVIGLTFMATMDFGVYKREEKRPQLAAAQEAVRSQYGLLVSERDPFGGYQPVGSRVKVWAMVAGAEYEGEKTERRGHEASRQ